MDDGTKRCSKCDSTKPIAEFSPRGADRRGRQAWCKPCLSAYSTHRSKIAVRQRRGLPLDAPTVPADSKPDGSTFLHRGYVIVKKTGHHRADKYGWVFEHVVVAEAKYGFPITREFTIHHKNGVRHDNRPENLELRWGNHGKGADVLPGLLRNPEMRAIARVILAQYDP